MTEKSAQEPEFTNFELAVFFSFLLLMLISSIISFIVFPITLEPKDPILLLYGTRVLFFVIFWILVFRAIQHFIRFVENYIKDETQENLGEPLDTSKGRF